MARVHKWSMKRMIEMIVKILENRFDCFIIIEGNRGLGKSTLALHLARGVSREFKKKGSDDYRFHWKNSLIYTKKETKQFWHKWRTIGIADEMINVAFNRDFYDSEQKDIIKMINMNRDHSNFFIACVPQFQTMDSQIKNLCKIRISVVKRGVAIIQTPNKTIYIKDKWDQATNEKMERTWLQKGVKHPHFAKLTTFRGVIKFPALNPKQEEKYQKTKDDKRNLVAKEEMLIQDEQSKETDPVKIMINLLQDGKVKNGTFVDGFAQANGIPPEKFKRRVRDQLKNNNLNPSIVNYYWTTKAQEKENPAI